jgi:hypothetical protein
MPKRASVGRSWRTPVKHELLNKMVGRIAGAASTEKVGALRFVAYDLCAGDGIPGDGKDFWYGTSPGILIHHAAGCHRRGMQRSIVILYEINPNTFNRLIENLTAHLGAPTATTEGKARFDYAPSEKIACTILAFCESGQTANLGCVSEGDCVFVCNDPNSIHDWAMRPTMIGEILTTTWMCTTFSTMGCNVGGLMMKSYEERKTGWYPHLQAVKHHLPRYTDLVLAAVDRDASKWAYAITAPLKWRDQTEADIRAAFNRIGRTMQIVWWRKNSFIFAELEDQLFLTRAERQDTQDGLFPSEGLR